MEEEIIALKYLKYIEQSLQEFFNRDRALLSNSRKTHEQTISFRLAHYLSSMLEPNKPGFYVDCEYHGDIYNKETGRKTEYIDGKLVKIRPDILFHDRGLNNRFAIEVKHHGMRDDYKKVQGYISFYHYHEGYCIYNFTKSTVTVNVFFPDCPEKGLKRKYLYDDKNHIMKLIHSDDFGDVTVL